MVSESLGDNKSPYYKAKYVKMIFPIDIGEMIATICRTYSEWSTCISMLDCTLKCGGLACH